MISAVHVYSFSSSEGGAVSCPTLSASNHIQIMASERRFFGSEFFYIAFLYFWLHSISGLSAACNLFLEQNRFSYYNHFFTMHYPARTSGMGRRHRLLTGAGYKGQRSYLSSSSGNCFFYCCDNIGHGIHFRQDRDWINLVSLIME